MAEKIEDNDLEETIVVEVPSDTETAAAVIADTMETFLETADVKRVYGNPIRRGDHTIIPTAEVLAGVGFGVGFGSGEGPMDEDPENISQGMGGGGGGGGRTFSRPVAVIITGPDGVRVEPVIDVTKIGLAALTAAGFMMTTLMRIKRGGRED